MRAKAHPTYELAKTSASDHNPKRTPGQIAVTSFLFDSEEQMLVEVEVNAKPECVQDTIVFLKGLFPETRAYDDCPDATVYLNEDGHTFLYIEHWDTKEHFGKYLSWREETGVFEQFLDFLEGPPNVRFFEPTDV